MKSACEYLPLNRKPIVEIIQDQKMGNGLAASQQISQGTPVVIYYGEKILDDRHTEMYLADPEQYLQEVAPYVRSNGNHSVDASGLIKKPFGLDNLNLMGVYVNDVAKLISLESKDIKAYLASQFDCNLIVGPETRDYPVYFANCKIKKRRTINGSLWISLLVVTIRSSSQSIERLLR